MVAARYFCDMVDINADGNISARELQGGFVTMMKDWKSLKRSWSGHATVSKAYHVSTMIVGVLIAVVIWMLVFNVAIDSVLLPLVIWCCHGCFTSSTSQIVFSLPVTI
jgi:hypothetical protein